MLQSVWQYRKVVIAATLLAALLGWVGSQLQPARYEATGEMLLTDPRDAGLFREVGPRSTDPTRYVRNQAQRLTSSSVAIRASELLDGAVAPADVRERVQAVPSSDLDLITLTVSGPTAEEAAAVANAVMQAYQDVVGAEMRDVAEESIAELEETRAQLQARIEEIEDVLADSPGNETAQLQRDAVVTELVTNQQLAERIAVDVALYGSGVEMVEPAVPPDAPVAPRTTMNTLLAAALGFGAAAAAAVWRASATRTADRRHEPAELLDVPLLGAVPDLGDLPEADAYPTVSAPDSPAAEAFRFVAAALEHALGDSVSTIAITSAQAGDGKTITAMNLAVALQQEAREVVLVDADVRVQGVSRLTGTDRRPGLTDLSDPAYPLERAAHLWRPRSQSTLPLVPAGTRQVEPTQFFRTAGYRTALHRVRESTDLVVIDAPPLLAVSDASAIAGSADAVIIVVSRGTPLHVLADLQERLTFVGAPVLGYVFNRATERRGGYGYGYGYGHGHGFGFGPGVPGASQQPPARSQGDERAPAPARSPGDAARQALSKRLPLWGPG